MQLDLLDHPKFKRLYHRLDPPRTHVLGILEMLWANGAAHARGECCLTGPLYRPGHIEMITDWTCTPGALEAALLELGWTDPAGEGCRLHEFVVHCPKSVKDRRDRYRV